MKLTILGSGSPEAYARRASTGYLLEIGNEKILFDCGGGVVDNLLRAGLIPSDITHLVFSHLHSDHMIDYPRLLHARWDEGGGPLAMWGPAPLAQVHDRFFGPNGALAVDLNARTQFPPSQEVWIARGGEMPRPWPVGVVTEIVAGDAIDGDGWRIDSCTVPHAQPYLDCLGFAVSAGEKRFVYSGDAGQSRPLAELAAGADTLLHWCYRLDGEQATPQMEALCPTPSEIGTMARKAGVKRLLLTHFRKHMDADDRNVTALAQAEAAFHGPVAIAEDLATFEI